MFSIKDFIIETQADFLSFFDRLKNNAKNFPLITKIYLPIIEQHKKRYEKEYLKSYIPYDYFDWLFISYFMELYIENNFDKIHCKIIEENLQKLENILGKESFRLYCRDLLKQCQHPIIYEVFKKLIDFHAEAAAMIEFADKGYKIFRISKKNGKQPDIKAVKEDEKIVIECKTIHPSNNIVNFLSHYAINLLGKLKLFPRYQTYIYQHDWYNFTAYDIIPRDSKVALKKDLSIEAIEMLKKFVREIRDKNLNENTMILNQPTHQICVHYNDNNSYEKNPVTISDQVEFVKHEVEAILNKKLKDPINNAVEQLNRDLEYKGYVKIIYIYCIKDMKHSLLWEKEMEASISQVVNDFQLKNVRAGIDKFAIRFFP